jgi:hypothetical protein
MDKQHAVIPAQAEGIQTGTRSLTGEARHSRVGGNPVFGNGAPAATQLDPRLRGDDETTFVSSDELI